MSVQDITGIVTAAVALLALIVAAIAARASWRTNQAQLQQLALSQRQYERQQAYQVSFWCSKPHNDYGNIPSIECTIVNASPLPIYDLRVVLIARRIYKVPRRSHPDGMLQYMALWYNDSLKADTNINDIVLDRETLIAHRPMEQRQNDIIGLLFRDCQGNTWYRAENGQLVDLTARQLFDIRASLQYIEEGRSPRFFSRSAHRLTWYRPDTTYRSIGVNMTRLMRYGRHCPTATAHRARRN